jgi:hypothetical protein
VEGDARRERVRGAIGPSSSSSSEMSRTFAENAAARSAYAESSRSSTADSFIDEPQPATLTTMVWTSAASKVTMSFRARSIASSSRPAWLDSAPLALRRHHVGNLWRGVPR